MQIQDKELADSFSTIQFGEDHDTERAMLNDLVAQITNPKEVEPNEAAREAVDNDDTKKELHDALKNIFNHLNNVLSSNGTLYSCEQMISALRSNTARLDNPIWKQLITHILTLTVERLAKYGSNTGHKKIDCRVFFEQLKTSITQLDQQAKDELLNVILILDQLRISYDTEIDQHELLTGMLYKMFDYYRSNKDYWSTLIDSLIVSIKPYKIYHEDKDEQQKLQVELKEKMEQDKKTKIEQWKLLKLEQDLFAQKTADKKNPRNKLLQEFHFQSQKILTEQDAAEARSTMQRVGKLIKKFLKGEVDENFTQEYTAIAKELKLNRSKGMRAVGAVVTTLGVLALVASFVVLALMYSPAYVGAAIGGLLIALAGLVLYKLGKPDGALAVFSLFNRARNAKTPEPANVPDAKGYTLVQ